MCCQKNTTKSTISPTCRRGPRGGRGQYLHMCCRMGPPLQLSPCARGAVGHAALPGLHSPAAHHSLTSTRGQAEPQGVCPCGSDCHIPLACTPLNHCSLGPALSPWRRQYCRGSPSLGKGRVRDPISTRAAPLDAAQKQRVLLLLQLLPLVSQTHPVTSSASFISAQPRDPSFQEAHLSPGLKHRILQLGDEGEQH